MQPIFADITQTVGGYLPTLIAAILILIVGWLVALLVRALIRGLLNRTTLDNRVAAWAGLDREGVDFNLESTIAKVVYYIILVFVFIAFFQVLGLTIITSPLNNLLNELLLFIPNLLAAAVLLLVAWLIATGLKFVTLKALNATNLDERLTRDAGLEEEDRRRVPLSETLANVVYWLVFLLFLPAILDALDMEGLLAPVMSMVNELLAYLPNLLAAALILLVGWLVARIVRQIVVGLLVAVGADRLGERVGINRVVGDQTLSTVIGTVVYILILIPAIIAALNALDIEAVSGPAAAMLTTFLNALPAIFGAIVILVLTYIIGRVVAGLVSNLLSSIGFDRVLALIGLGGTQAELESETHRTPSDIVGYLVLIGLMLFATIEAANLLGFEIVAVIVGEFLVFAGDVILGLIIIGLGLYLANVARNVVLSTAGTRANFLSHLARISIIILAVAMGLRQMGIAESIVNLAFGLMLGAIAVAAAIAFGLGGREVARREVEVWFRELRGGSTTEPPASPPTRQV